MQQLEIKITLTEDGKPHGAACNMSNDDLVDGGFEKMVSEVAGLLAADIRLKLAQSTP